MPLFRHNKAEELMLSTDEAEYIYNKMDTSVRLCFSSKVNETYNRVVKKAIAYTVARIKYKLASDDKRDDLYKTMNSEYEEFRIAINILAHTMEENKVDTSWYARLGGDRNQNSDYACYITYHTALAIG